MTVTRSGMLALRRSIMLLTSTASALPNALRDDAASPSKRLPIIQRLEKDDTIPEGLRLATVEDAKANKATFALVLRKHDIAYLSDGKLHHSASLTMKMAGWGYSSRIELLANPAEVLGHKLAVRFAPGVTLSREETERTLSRVGLIAWRLLVAAVWLSCALDGLGFLGFLRLRFSTSGSREGVWQAISGRRFAFINAFTTVSTLIGTPLMMRRSIIARRGSIF